MCTLFVYTHGNTPSHIERGLQIIYYACLAKLNFKSINSLAFKQKSSMENIYFLEIAASITPFVVNRACRTTFVDSIINNVRHVVIGQFEKLSFFQQKAFWRVVIQHCTNSIIDIYIHPPLQEKWMSMFIYAHTLVPTPTRMPSFRPGLTTTCAITARHNPRLQLHPDHLFSL